MTMSLSNPTKRTAKIDWWIYSIPAILALSVFFYLFVHSRPGVLGLVTFYLAPLIIDFLSVLFLIIGIIRSLLKPPFINYWRLAGFAGLIALCFTNNVYGKYPSYYDDKPSKIAFRLPVDTSISVAWGGGQIKNNYHVEYPDQCWAYDLIVVKDGKTYSGDSTSKENYYSYGLKVVAPAKGKIIETYDDDPDMPVGTLGGGKEPHGNYIILEVAPREFIFLCHLQPNSVRVCAGDTVSEGQELARIGNSGNTSEPHLHIHLQNSKELSFGEGIPLYFHHYIADGKYVDKGIPTGGFDEMGNVLGQTIQNTVRQ